jgi:hypothetical protein
MVSMSLKSGLNQNSSGVSPYISNRTSAFLKSYNATTGAGMPHDPCVGAAELLAALAKASHSPDPLGSLSSNLSPSKHFSPLVNEPAHQRVEWCLAKLGRLALYNGNLVDAFNYFQREFERAKRHGTAEEIAESANDLAYVSVLTGDQTRARELYSVALSAWREVSPKLAIKSPRVISAFALFLHDYAEFLTMKNNLIIAARAKRRLKSLADRFSPFTVYSAVAKQLRDRGQGCAAKMMSDRARPTLVNKAKAAYTNQLLNNIRSYEESSVYLPPLKISAE